MAGLATSVPPAVVLFALALVVASVPRRAGNALAVAVSLAVCAWLFVVPAGAHLDTLLFGFDAVLFNVDVYSRLLGVAFAFIAAVGVAYGHLTGANRRQTAYALGYLGTGLGTVFAGDWLTLVVFWELMAVCATVLVWHRTTDRGAGVRYAVYHEIGGLLLMAGVLLDYAATGTFVFGDGITAGLPAVLVALGIGLNAGFLGLHVWLVDTYPTTHVASSAVLAAVTTKVGAYAIVRAFPDGHTALAYVGAGMVLFGVTFAILQTDMRRLLSYHIVSQVGYMVVGFSAGSALASAGAMGHLVNNILYKSLLFMVAGVVVQRTGRESLKKLGGLGRATPLLAGLFAVAAFSIAGVPGFNGFVSKGMVLDGVQKAGYEGLWYALLLGGVGTVVSFAKFGYYAFLRHAPANSPSPATVPDLDPLELATLGSVAALCLLLGLVPNLLLDLLPATGVGYAKPFAAKQFLKAGAVTAAGVLLFAAIRTRLRHVTPVAELDAVYHPLGRRLQSATVRAAVLVEAAIQWTGAFAGTTASTAVSLAYARKRLPAESRLDSRSIGAGILAAVLLLIVLLAILR